MYIIHVHVHVHVGVHVCINLCIILIHVHVLTVGRDCTSEELRIVTEARVVSTVLLKPTVKYYNKL